MGKTILIINIFFLMTRFSLSQIYSDTAIGEVGDELSVNINIPDSNTTFGTNKFSGTIFITNPTVFYPDTIISTLDFLITKNDLKRKSDSLWNFYIELQKTSDTTSGIKISLKGEALAGTDSVCTLDFSNIKLNNKPIKDFSILIITHTLGIPSSYYRFARLKQNFPNPIEEGGFTKWHYNLDKPSVVEFYIIDYRAKETFLINLGEQSYGIHEYIFEPGMGYTSGVYWMKLKTNSGESIQPFVIVK
ncbi:MAG: hypothetical protein EPN82_10560 [Bacteroidetes bacterium]|nr:MAG: hypothetical protein EPN82_10560 [Bacteroidota bacterium]